MHAHNTSLDYCAFGWGRRDGVVMQRGIGLGNFKLILNHTKIETQTVTFWEKDEREGKMKGKER